MELQRTAKTILTVALIAGLALIGAACDNENDVTPSTTAEAENADGVVSADNPSGLDSDTMDQLYLSTVRGGADSFAGIDDATLIEFGQAVCTGFDSGATFAELAAMGLDTTLDNIDLGYTMGVAVGAYCPEYTDQLG
jgi:hypothetical protein